MQSLKPPAVRDLARLTGGSDFDGFAVRGQAQLMTVIANGTGLELHFCSDFRPSEGGKPLEIELRDSRT